MTESVIEWEKPNGKLILGDCLEKMQDIPDNSVDMILCDLPYGKTQNNWDSIIPLKLLWEEYWRICNGVIALTGTQPFTSMLVVSQFEYFKYDWVWKKQRGIGHLNAKIMPMKDKEDICIFYKKNFTYNPQFLTGKPYSAQEKGSKRITQSIVSKNYGNQITAGNSSDGKRYPKQILEFDIVQRPVHPTQKPVALFEYLIKTYTNKGDTVLDNCAGSGTTAIAAINTWRNWICIEKEKEYFDLSADRIDNHIEEINND